MSFTTKRNNFYTSLSVKSRVLANIADTGNNIGLYFQEIEGFYVTVANEEIKNKILEYFGINSSIEQLLYINP